MSRGIMFTPCVLVLSIIVLIISNYVDGLRVAGRNMQKSRGVPYMSSSPSHGKGSDTSRSSVLTGINDFSVFDDGSRLLSGASDSAVENDGFTESIQSARKIAFKNFVRRVMRRMPNPGTLIMVRHGESMWNYNSTFTGWVDVDLSPRGVQEVEHASRLLLERGYTVDIAFTSRLKRAIRSVWIILGELNQIYRPVFKSWRLNERMYGSLEGGSKIEAAVQHGEDQVQKWRRDLYERPPIQTSDHPFWHGNERKYADLDEMPLTESLSDTMKRTQPLWDKRILPALQAGQNVLVVAHANSMRGLIKHIDNLSADEISKVGIPNGIPLIYKFDRDKKEKSGNLTPVRQRMAVAPLTGEFLEEKGLLRQALQREEELVRAVPGYSSALAASSSQTPFKGRVNDEGMNDPMLRGLLQLDTERKLIGLVSETLATASQRANSSRASTMEESEGDSTTIHEPSLRVEGQNHVFSKSSLTGRQMVIIRHGKTNHNKLGLFTGWEDAALAYEGRQEARNAGRLLRKHGVVFDCVYTSWLSRAIETAWLVLDEVDMLWLPIIKTWRLNERMYGALTGLSKVMVKERHGKEQFKAWRRGYQTRPPRVTSFSSNYPGNDDRYRNYVRDIRYSFRESIVRSFSVGRLELHRKFPKSESLKDCMDRTIPYFSQNIMPDFLEKNKTILVASSENAIRGMLMYLLDIPPERINEVEIPTGLPLVYDADRNRIQILDDGKDDDILKKYNFGSSPELLFDPCDDDDVDECFVIGGRSYAYDPLVRLPNSAPWRTSDGEENEGESAEQWGTRPA